MVIPRSQVHTSGVLIGAESFSDPNHKFGIQNLTLRVMLRRFFVVF